VKKIALGSVFDHQHQHRKEAATVEGRKKEAVDHWLVRLDGEDDDVPFSEHSFGKTLEGTDALLWGDSDASMSITSPAAVKPTSVQLPVMTTPPPRVVSAPKTRSRSGSPSNKEAKETPLSLSSDSPTSVVKSTLTAAAVVTPTLTSQPVSSATESPNSPPATRSRSTTPTPPTTRSKPLPRKPAVASAAVPTYSKPRVNTRSSGQILYTATDNVETLLKRRPTTRKRKEEAFSRKSEDGEEQSVVKIPMKTGILYLYRGKRRSAKFVPLK